MRFRTANMEDAPQLMKMRLAYLTEDHGELSEKETEIIIHQLTSYFPNHLGKDLMVYLGEEDSEIVSTVFILVIEKPANPSFLTGKTGTVLNVYTKQDYRRQGIAGTLMKMAMEDAAQKNLSYLELKATEGGRFLYAELGFSLEKSKYQNMKYFL